MDNKDRGDLVTPILESLRGLHLEDIFPRDFQHHADGGASDADSSSSSSATGEVDSTAGPDQDSSLHIRGIVNVGNTCYLSSVFQCLFAVPSFNSLLSKLSHFILPDYVPQKCPVLVRLITFYKRYQQCEELPSATAVPKPVTPEEFVDVLQDPKYPFIELNQQSDAEEFLTFLLSTLHDEWKAWIAEDKERNSDDESSTYESSDDDDDEGGWEEVGAGNKTVVLHTHAIEEAEVNTPIGSCFRGVLRTNVKRPRQKPSASLEPFYMLSLDISSREISCISDAIEAYVAPEEIPIDGSDASVSSTSRRRNYGNTDASRNVIRREVEFDRFPDTLVLAVQRFRYDERSGSLKKVTKAIDIDRVLEIPLSIASAAERARIQMLEGASQADTVRYELVAMASHRGSECYRGHYDCFVRKRDGTWDLVDETRVVRSKWDDVKRNTIGAYLLFYALTPT